MTDLSAPILTPEQLVLDDWTDRNGHLNMAFYHVIFDLAIDMALAEFGVGAQHTEINNLSVFTAEAHIHYLRELNAGDRVQVSLQVLGSDSKRLHYVQTMERVGDGENEGFVAAITENMVLSVDLTTRRVAPWAPDVAERLAAIAVGHSALPVPRQVGRAVGLRWPKQS